MSNNPFFAKYGVVVGNTTANSIYLNSDGNANTINVTSNVCITNTLIVTSTANITTTVSVGNSTVNTSINATSITTNAVSVGNSTVNTSLTSASLFVGNSSVNTNISSAGIVFNNVQTAFSNVYITSNGLASGTGNLTANIVVNVISANTLQFLSGGVANSAQSAISVNTVWDSANFVTLTDAANVSWDMSTGINFKLTLGGARTMSAPTAVLPGKSGYILIKQDGTGSRTLAWNSVYNWKGGTVPTLTTTASAVDKFSYLCENSTSIYMSYELNNS